MGTLLQTSMPKQDAKPSVAGAALAALGIVYGDIGTSPLYALKQAVASWRDAHPGHRHGCRVTDPLVIDPHRLAQVRHPDHARRQPRRGRHHGPAGASRRPPRPCKKLAGVTAYLRIDWSRPPLWRRGDHARHLGAERCRGCEARCPATCAGGPSPQHRYPVRLVHGATQRNAIHRRRLWPGHVALVWSHWPPRPTRHYRGAPHPRRSQSTACCRVPGQCGPGHRVCRVGSRVLGCHRRRSNVCRHGSLRPPAHTGAAGLPSCYPLSCYPRWRGVPWRDLARLPHADLHAGVVDQGVLAAGEAVAEELARTRAPAGGPRSRPR